LKIIFEVVWYNGDFDMTLEGPRTTCSSTNRCLDKNRDSPHFDNGNTASRASRIEDGMQQLDGSVRRCVPRVTLQQSNLKLQSTFFWFHNWPLSSRFMLFDCLTAWESNHPESFSEKHIAMEMQSKQTDDLCSPNREDCIQCDVAVLRDESDSIDDFYFQNVRRLKETLHVCRNFRIGQSASSGSEIIWVVDRIAGNSM
jgi:hypothetical protein